MVTGQTKWNGVDISGAVFIALDTPVGLTQTSFTFEVSDTDADANYKPLYSGGTQVSVPVGPSRAIDLGSVRAALAPWKYMRVVFNTGATADRIVGVNLK